MTPSNEELGAAWREEMAAKEAELAERKRDLAAAQAEVYVGEAERTMKVDRINTAIAVISSDIIALGLVLERARKVRA